jgi:hypothetical protein
MCASRVGEDQGAGGVDLGAAALLCVTARDCDCEYDLSGHRSRSNIRGNRNRDSDDCANCRG